MSKWNSESEEGWYVSLSNKKLGFTMKYGHDILNVSTPGNFVDGQWHHFAVSYSSGETITRLYVDGQQVDTISGSSNVSTNVPLTIGGAGKNQGKYFEGKLDEIMIFRRSLGETEAKSMFDISNDFSRFCQTLLSTERDEEKGLVANWPLDEDSTAIKDRVSRQGTTVSGNVRSRPGILNSSLKFSGNNSVLTIPHRPELNLSSPMSVSVWVYPERQKQQHIITKGPVTNGRDASPYSILLTASGDLVFSLNTSEGFTQLRSVGYEPKRWYYLVGTYDGATVKFYLNGKKTTSLPVNGRLSDNPLPILIGAGREGNGHFEGRIDEVKLYNRVLGSEEVKKNYRQLR
jgi:hypothetical protein